MTDANPGEPIAYLNGQFVPINEAKVSIFDLGLVQAVSVTDMIRTFGHVPFRLDEHISRLERSLKVVGIECGLSQDDLHRLTQEVVTHNAGLIPETHDLGIVLFVTAGTNLTYVGAAGMNDALNPTVCIHTFPLPFELWAQKFETGQHLVTPSIRHIPPDCIDPKIKMRSRMHWYLADRQAKLVDSTAGSLLLDHNGNITETSSANFFLVTDGEIRTPGHAGTLGGLSQQTVAELAEKIGVRCVSTALQPYDVTTADEAFTTSTPYCLLPVTRFNGQPIGEGRPGPMFSKIVAAWNQLVGLDIMDQMRCGATDRTASAS
jgi:branched-subunit amino acid aminotransferase/4-amino-4-deoxychorismate lyase